jgi:hypothetical protein
MIHPLVDNVCNIKILVAKNGKDSQIMEVLLPSTLTTEIDFYN